MEYMTTTSEGRLMTMHNVQTLLYKKYEMTGDLEFLRSCVSIADERVARCKPHTLDMFRAISERAGACAELGCETLSHQDVAKAFDCVVETTQVIPPSANSIWIKY